ncbi:DUF5666 domain-containing protein [Aquabacterium sp.]|uniref:DUF5666 domain-containing protein n=1 Tax=Aquabacterium sp. TaxID=1872578 RepID=UPI002486E10E|nr:DUF5666 domain-containing protein [Aquabacterium sp.]MDI1351083.1 DUF5666 domain-containing protein [Aquabacterium sp.]
MQHTTSLNSLRLNTLTPLRGRLALSALASAAVLALAACGGGGSGSSTASSSGQATTAATYSGAVSGLGSIVVNGVRFSTSSARATDAETEGAYARAFALGTTVSVTGDVDDNSATATASSITVHGGVRGAVTATTASTLTVAGQTIQVDANTVFEGLNSASLSLAGLKAAVDAANLTVTAADTVYAEVYVVGDATSGFLATRVEQKAAIAEGYAVVGKTVTGSLNATSFGLLLRNGVTVTVDYSTATVRPNGVTLAEGTAVRVVSTTNPSTLSSGDTLTASKVVVKRDRAITGRAKVRGAVAAISGTTLTVNDVTVDVSQARFDDGLTLAGLTVGTVLKVEGTFTNGVLVAREVEADNREYDAANGGGVKLYGVVSSATVGTPSTFSIQGVTLTLPATGVTLPTNGTYVEVVARLVNGVLTVVRIGSEDNRAQRSFELYGTTPCATGSSDLMTSFPLTLRNGTTTTVDGRTATIELENSVSMTSGLANAQCFVEVKGAVTSTNTVTATRIEVKARTVTPAN